MSEHLCLKWNNHSIAFLRGIKNIELKEKYCDATIVCQGKYFPVHRFVLSTCSEYFEEIFDRIKCPHPYIVFKDIEPREIDLLLSYMYQGEVNVLQAILPTFIKAAEALKIKGLAVPDDIPSNKEEKSRKRPSSSTDVSHPKRRGEEFARRRDGSNTNRESSSESNVRQNQESDIHKTECISIKEEPQEDDPQVVSTEFDGATLEEYPSIEDSNYIKSEPTDNADLPVDDQSWSGGGDLSEDFNTIQNFGASEAGLQNDDIRKKNPAALDKFRSLKPNAESDDPLKYGQWSAQRFDKYLISTAGCHQCSLCNYKSYNVCHVKRHIMNKHTKERPFPCTLCSARFTQKFAVDRHMLTHFSDNRFSCPRCSERFSSPKEVEDHVVKDH